MSIGNEDEIVSDHGSGDRNVTTAGELPNLLAGRRVIAADVLPAIDQEYVAAAHGVDGRCAPSRVRHCGACATLRFRPRA